MKPAMLYARNIFGNSVFDGFAHDGDDWESYGFSVDEDGNPERDQNGNTIAWYEAEEFDPENPDHVQSAVEYATSDGCRDRETLQDYLCDELGISQETFDAELSEWCEEDN